MERFCSETEAKKERGRVVVIAGPTAVGKSKVAHALAARLDGEVISADSVQVYRGLDIGSNKPSVTERQSITYHLVDIMEPSCDAFSAGSFFQLARQATADILHRHRLPIVVGGTMMYLRWYILGKPATVAATPAITQAVVEELELDGWDWDRCLARLAAVDPARAAALHRNDWYRLRRAMEVVKSTGGIGIGALPRLGGAPSASTPSRDMAFRGVVPSETPSVNDAASTEQCNSQADDSELDYNFYCYFLVLPRALLNRLIDARCEDMVARGLLQETAALLQGPWAHAHALEESFPFPRLDNGALTAFRAIGYRQSIEYLIRGERTPQGLRLFLEKFMQASRQYARRQIQWYRSEQRFRWRAADRPDLVESIENELLSDKTHFRGHDEEDRRLRDESYREAKSMKRYRPTLQLFDTDERAWQVLREVDWFRPTSHPAEAKPF
jgi:tRNA dimethylallyltransferase